MMNPILKREMVTTLREFKSYGLVALYLLSVSVFLTFFMNTFGRNYDYSFAIGDFTGLYVWIATAQITLIVFVVPALSAGSISGEREKQTLDLLLVTKMSPFAIVMGKLMSSIVFIILLIVATLPMFSFLFYVDSLRLGDIFTLCLYILTTTYLFAGTSVFCSTIYRKTNMAIGFSYCLVIIFCVGFFALAILICGLSMQNEKEVPFLLVYALCTVSPIIGFIIMTISQIYGMTEILYVVEDIAFSTPYHTNTSPSVMTEQHIWFIEHIFIFNMMVQVLIGTFFVFIASKLLVANRKTKLSIKKKVQKKEIES